MSFIELVIEEKQPGDPVRGGGQLKGTDSRCIYSRGEFTGRSLVEALLRTV